MNSYLFLDFDGVLNSHDYFFGTGAHRRYAKPGMEPNAEDRLLDAFDPDALGILDRIVEESGCFVVISSSWRILNTVGGMRRAMRSRGFKHGARIVGKTGYRVDGDNTNRRGLEIEDWILRNTVGGIRLAILDDSADMGKLMSYLVRTTWEHGLREQHVQPTLKLLSTP